MDKKKRNEILRRLKQNNAAPWRTVSTVREALAKMRESTPDYYDVIWRDAHAIEHWSDYSFTTGEPESRTFAVFANRSNNGDNSLLHRFLAAPAHKLSCLVVASDRTVVERLNKVAGFILEVGTNDRPLIFGDDEALRTAWLGLHEQYKVLLSDEEQDFFDAHYVNEDENEEGETAEN